MEEVKEKVEKVEREAEEMKIPLEPQMANSQPIRHPIRVYGRGDKIPKNSISINATSRSKDPRTRKLSPFFLGPVNVSPESEEISCKLFENAWQYLKVYPKHSNLKEWEEWSNEGFNSEVAHRFPMGRGAKPLYSRWKGRKLGYIEARFEIYAPLYANSVQTYAPDILLELITLWEEGKQIAIFDYDGYDYLYNGVDLQTVIYNSKRKMGHGFALAMLIMGNRLWEKGFDENKIHQTTMKKARY